MSYDSHPSEELNSAFSIHPFQGAKPEKATFLFVGLDANYRKSINESRIFPRLLEYLDDGIAFWHEYGVHHPFLLTEYTGDGKFYHQSFAKIGFGPQHAAQVSFIEMLHVPTVGISKLTIQDLDENHLLRVHDAIEHGDARHIFVPPQVAGLMRESSVFPWMPKVSADMGGPLKIWRKAGPKTIYWHYHFSVYGKFEQKKAEQLKAIGQLISMPA